MSPKRWDQFLTKRRWDARPDEGVGLPPVDPRDPAHEDPQWFEKDLDDALNDPDEEPVHPMPTERYWRVP